MFVLNIILYLNICRINSIENQNLKLWTIKMYEVKLNGKLDFVYITSIQYNIIFYKL